MKHFSFLLLLLPILTACDSGDVHEVYHQTSSGRTAQLTASDVKEWEDLPEGYNLALAAFGSNSQYALGQRILSSSDVEDGRLRVVLAQLSDTVSTVELCVTNTLRKKVLSLQSQDATAQSANDTIRLECMMKALTTAACLQTGFFDEACIRCHGGGNHSARGLNLTTGHSVTMLVNVPSASHPDVLRVSGGEPEESLLHQILAESGAAVLHVNHVEILHKLGVDTDVLRTFIDEWIKSLPPKDPNS